MQEGTRSRTGLFLCGTILLAVVQKNAENVAALIEQEGDETCLTRLMDAITVTSEYKYFNIIEP